jgi:hypothetical protein
MELRTGVFTVLIALIIALQFILLSGGEGGKQ